MTGSDTIETVHVDAGNDGESEQYELDRPDGLVSADDHREATRVLARTISDPRAPDGGSDRRCGDLLVVDASDGLLAIVAAARNPDASVVATETSARAATTCRANAERNGVDVAVELTPSVSDIRGGFDRALVVPKPYDPVDVVSARLAGACSRLCDGGDVFIGGTPQAGIERYADALDDLLGTVELFERDGSVRVYRARRAGGIDGDCVSRTDGVGSLPDHEFRATVDGYTCRLLSVPGLFSWEDLDAGTETLLETVDVPDGARVLDCCCGYGAIAAFVGARTDCAIWATDDDVVATTYARRNAERNGVTTEAVVTGDCVDAVADQQFDIVLTNPPTHAGAGVTEKLFRGIHDVLAGDGALYLVANQIMDYAARLETEFAYETDVIARKDRYEIIQARPERGTDR